jgi:hypothetical protein
MYRGRVPLHSSSCFKHKTLLLCGFCGFFFLCSCRAYGRHGAKRSDKDRCDTCSLIFAFEKMPRFHPRRRKPEWRACMCYGAIYIKRSVLYVSNADYPPRHLAAHSLWKYSAPWCRPPQPRKRTRTRIP